MTNKEAIELIENDIKLHHDYLSGKYRHALRMAVDALKQADRKTEPQYDFSEYADRLWRIAYERGKREALAKDEPQTCSVNGRPYDCGNCEYHKCMADEPQTDKGVSYSDHTDYKEPKTYVTWTEPQKERSRR